jgi:hypothetical protein
MTQPNSESSRRFVWLRLFVALMMLALLLLAYSVTLQTQISGTFSENQPGGTLKNEYIKDVSEIQVALNVWGTIHHTGYPLYAILGNLFTAPLRLIGIEPAAAASLYATVWGGLALLGFALLLRRITGQTALAITAAAVLGFVRSIWVHNVIAEVYSMSLAITVLLLLVALWPGLELRRRFLWLALLGGIGVAHHRAVAFIAPGLFLAIWPQFRRERDHRDSIIAVAIVLALIGFLPYIYLPLRAWQGGAWVYGEPGTWHGFWIEFTGKEAQVNNLMTRADSLQALIDNGIRVWEILVAELTLPGLLLGFGGTAAALIDPKHRRTALVVLLCAVGPLLFAIIYHTAVMPEAVLMPVSMVLIFEATLAADFLVRHWSLAIAAALIVFSAWGIDLLATHYEYIRELVAEPSGVETIERLHRVPTEPPAAVIIPWGPRYAAASYAHLVTGELDDLRIVNHKADYHDLLDHGYHLYTEPETFYTFPLPWTTALPVAPSTWWIEHLGSIYLSSAAPGLVEINVVPWIAEAGDSEGMPIVGGIMLKNAWLTCDAESIYLHLIWFADNRPNIDPSIYVHLTGDQLEPNPVNADTRYPVYGLYPFSRLSPGELVRDDFTLPRLPGKTMVRYGLYEQDAAGNFVNYGEGILLVADCAAE